jgi:hypothetical protein
MPIVPPLSIIFQLCTSMLTCDGVVFDQKCIVRQKSFKYFFTSVYYYISLVWLNIFERHDQFRTKFCDVDPCKEKKYYSFIDIMVRYNYTNCLDSVVVCAI